MLYYALFYATSIPTIVYAQVVGDEPSSEPIFLDDSCMDAMIDLCDLPWLEDEICTMAPTTQAAEQVVV